jgi:phosphatidate phosphatase APP1
MLWEPRVYLLARLFTLVLVLAALPATAGPAVLLTPVLGRSQEVTLQGRVLAAAPRGSTALTRNVRRLLTRNQVGARVELSFLGVSATVTSGNDGDFQVTLRPPEGHTFPAGLHKAEARVKGAHAEARVEILPDTMPFLVISDFDDTVAITQVTEPEKLVANALLRDADTQKAVPGMAAFYGCLGAEAGGTPAFALVSGSPIQFASRVEGFLSRHRFPPFGLYLRDLGPDTLSGYKQPLIRTLLRQFSQPVVLVGDSGEHDPEVYAQIRDEFPGRVRAIYIRDAGRTGEASRFKDMVLFQDVRSAAEHAVQSGLARPACLATAFPPPAPVEKGAP